MREIIFRGRCKRTNEWIYGSLKKRSNNSYAILQDDAFYWCEVQSETIGQYIGTIDFKGNKIFESDIVELNDHDHEYNNSNYIHKGIVFYNHETASFMIKFLNSNYLGAFGTIEDFELEILGNIHENPELLEDKNGQSKL